MPRHLLRPAGEDMSEQKDVVALSDHDDEIVRSRAIKVLVMGMGRTGTTCEPDKQKYFIPISA